jgi:signal transduction histidine kinase/ActR/RegA family two-component response regulator
MKTLTSSIGKEALLLFVCFGGLFWASRYHYLLFHSLVESFAVVVAFSIFTLVWATRHLPINNYLRFIGPAYLAVGLIDLLHMLAFPGMGVFGVQDPGIATQLWLGARYVESGSLLLAALLIGRRIPLTLMIAGHAAVTVLLMLTIFHWAIFPTAYVAEVGLTPFKIASEYAISAVLLVSLGLLWRLRGAFDPVVFRLLAAALVITVFSEMAFTLYLDPTGVANLVGHFLKVISFYLVYKAIVGTALVRPYDLLFRDLQQAKAEAENACRAKDKFLSALSHELRTPLTPVLAVADELRERRDLPAELREQVEIIRRNVELQVRLIDDLLDLRRVGEGKIELRLAACNMNRLLEQVMQICQPALESGQLRLFTDFTADRTWVWGDAARLQQALWNLLKNAIKFTPPGGSITLSSWNDISRQPAEGAVGETQVVVEVTDTGIGIERQALQRIFDPFEQVDPSITMQYGGLGLGLAITQEMIHSHGGTITAESAGPGTGSRFRIALRAIAAPVPVYEEQQQPVERGRLLRILLVEDHVDTAVMLARLLRRMNHEVDVAHNMQDAIDLLSGSEPDLLISDLGLPDGSGLKLMRTVQSLRPIPGICLSGYGSARDLKESRDAGYCCHLVKPVDLAALRIAMDEAVAGKHEPPTAPLPV